MRILKQSHSAEKSESETLLDLLTYILLQNIRKARRGDPLGTLKNFQKKSHSAGKQSKRGILQSRPVL